MRQSLVATPHRARVELGLGGVAMHISIPNAFNASRVELGLGGATMRQSPVTTLLRKSERGLQAT